MKIQVTKLDIDRGLQGNPFACPVTRAVRRIMGYNKNVDSGRNWITVGQTVYFTPIDVIGFMNAFDVGKRVEPFEFELVPALLGIVNS